MAVSDDDESAPLAQEVSDDDESAESAPSPFACATAAAALEDVRSVSEGLAAAAAAAAAASADAAAARNRATAARVSASRHWKKLHDDSCAAAQPKNHRPLFGPSFFTFRSAASRR